MAFINCLIVIMIIINKLINDFKASLLFLRGDNFKIKEQDLLHKIKKYFFQMLIISINLKINLLFLMSYYFKIKEQNLLQKIKKRYFQMSIISAFTN